MLRVSPIPLSVTIILAAPALIGAQNIDGSTLDTALGAALGAYSGATLGLIGGMSPCGRTTDGLRCAVSAASVGGALGLAMGGIVGSQHRGLMIDRAENAALGGAVGAVGGLVLRRAVHAYGWPDVAATTLVGGAIGAAPNGVLLGTGAGALTGSLVWLLLPEGGVQDLVLFTLAGAALGGMLDWAHAATQRPGSAFGASFSLGL